MKQYSWSHDALVAAIAILLYVLLVYSCAAKGASLSPHQLWALNYAKQTGQPYPETLAAIIWQESSLCKYKTDREGGIGCGHIFKGAVKAAWQMTVSRYSLLSDDKLNIHIAAAYLGYCIDRTRNWSRAVVCFNSGPYYAQHASWQHIIHNKYLLNIKRRIWQIRRLRER